MIKALEGILPSLGSNKTIVLDAGIATSRNIHWLKRDKYHYIVVNRGKLSFGKALSPLIILMKLDKNYTINEGFSLKVIFPLHCYDRKKRN